MQVVIHADSGLVIASARPSQGNKVDAPRLAGVGPARRGGRDDGHRGSACLGTGGLTILHDRIVLAVRPANFRWLHLPYSTLITRCTIFFDRSA